MTDLLSVARAFAFEGEILSVIPHGAGHINKTFMVTCKGDHRYILQQVNARVFPDTAALAANIQRVTDHIRRKAEKAGRDPDRATLTPIPTREGGVYHRQGKGIWRAFLCISRSLTLQKAEGPTLFKTGYAFGEFAGMLADLPAHTLYETVPDFHHTPRRFLRLEEVVKADPFHRCALAKEEITKVLAQFSFVGVIADPLRAGKIPAAVTHNDTKLNNLLFDEDTLEPLAVVDLDTVMPGTRLYDFGDGVRYGCNPAAEDEADILKVQCDLNAFTAYTAGYLAGCNGVMTPLERALMPESCRLLALECAIRFLTDYLEGDVYFAVCDPTHNLRRCRAQLALAADMERKQDEMHKIVEEAGRHVF